MISTWHVPHNCSSQVSTHSLLSSLLYSITVSYIKPALVIITLNHWKSMPIWHEMMWKSWLYKINHYTQVYGKAGNCGIQIFNFKPAGAYKMAVWMFTANWTKLLITILLAAVNILLHNGIIYSRFTWVFILWCHRILKWTIKPQLQQTQSCIRY